MATEEFKMAAAAKKMAPPFLWHSQLVGCGVSSGHPVEQLALNVGQQSWRANPMNKTCWEIEIYRKDNFDSVFSHAYVFKIGKSSFHNIWTSYTVIRRWCIQNFDLKSWLFNHWSPSSSLIRINQANASFAVLKTKYETMHLIRSAPRNIRIKMRIRIKTTFSII